VAHTARASPPYSGVMPLQGRTQWSGCLVEGRREGGGQGGGEGPAGRRGVCECVSV
jgi:hypothetical protein